MAITTVACVSRLQSTLRAARIPNKRRRLAAESALGRDVPMQADIDKQASIGLVRHSGYNAKPKLIECPFEVRIDWLRRDQFYCLRDALACARIAKQSNPTSAISVTDVRTGKLVLEV